MAETHILKKETVVVEGQRLPEDLIEDILVNLPVKSLLRLRCVCKSWFHLIKSSNFIQRHFNCHKSIDEILIFNRDGYYSPCFMSFHSYETFDVTSPILEMSPLDYGILVDVGGPCNGLICVSDFRMLVLCNPAMREFKVLPPLPFRDQHGNMVVRYFIGLGFDSIRNDYKVVVMFGSCRTRWFRDDVQKAAVYNLSTNSWREIHRDSSPLLLTSISGTLFNGALHWVLENKPKILSFDIETEVFQDMEFPDHDYDRKNKHLMVLNESLVLFICDPEYNSVQIVDVWKQHKYGVAESWTKEFTVGPLTGPNRPVLLWKNEAIILERRLVDKRGLVGNESELVLCAINTRKMRKLNIRAADVVPLSVMVYRESLISIK